MMSSQPILGLSGYKVSFNLALVVILSAVSGNLIVWDEPWWLAQSPSNTGLQTPPSF
jgi:hypothetical protein